MGRASGIQNSFDGGELSPLLLGRQDLDKYKHGLFTCLNGLPFTQGPWTRRPGTAFLHQTKFPDAASRLFPFQFSTTQTYVLEINGADGDMRFYTAHGILTEATQSITSITKANPGVVTKVAHGYVNNDRIQLSNMVGMTQLNNREVNITKLTNDTFQIKSTETSGGVGIDTTNYGTFVSGSMAKIFRLVTPYVTSTLNLVRMTQSADTVYITHPDFAPQILTRVSALSWSIASIAFTDGPYDNQNTTTTTLTPAAATGTNVVLNASAVTGINNNTGFSTNDIGRLIRMKEGAIWGYAVIVQFNNSTQVLIDILSTLTNTNAKTAWRLGVWSKATGFPSCSAFYEDRLYFAGPAVFPQRLDGSNVSGYTNFSPSATDGTVSSANAVSATLNSDDVNAILWMSPHTNALLIGTTRGEWQVRGTTQGDAITPTNIQFKPTTRRGSASIAPVKAGDGTLFVQRGGRKLREMAAVVDGYGYTYKTPDMTALSEHITYPAIAVQLAYQEQPQAIVWAPRSDGALIGMSYDRDAGVVAWHRHELGGSSSADGLSIPVVESVAVVVDPTGVRDELYLVVKRYVNGSTKRYIEYMSKVWQTEDVQENAFYVDCGWTDLTPATNIISGLWFLEGQTVGVYVDGALQPNATITNGIATLTAAGTIKTIGYFYNSDGQTMPLEGGTQDGSAQGKLKRIAKLGLWVMDTLGLKYGPNVSTLTELIVRAWGQAYGTSTPLATGIFRERFEGDHDKLGQVYWRANGPFPANVLALAPQYEVADDS